MLKESKQKLEEIYQLLNSLEIKGVQNVRIVSEMVYRMEQIVKEEDDAINVIKPEKAKEG